VLSTLNHGRHLKDFKLGSHTESFSWKRMDLGSSRTYDQESFGVIDRKTGAVTIEDSRHRQTTSSRDEAGHRLFHSGRRSRGLTVVDTELQKWSPTFVCDGCR